MAVALMLAFGAPAAVHAQTTSRAASDPDSVPTVVVSASALGLTHDFLTQRGYRNLISTALK